MPRAGPFAAARSRATSAADPTRGAGKSARSPALNGFAAEPLPGLPVNVTTIAAKDSASAGGSARRQARSVNIPSPLAAAGALLKRSGKPRPSIGAPPVRVEIRMGERAEHRDVEGLAHAPAVRQGVPVPLLEYPLVVVEGGADVADEELRPVPAVRDGLHLLDREGAGHRRVAVRVVAHRHEHEVRRPSRSLR